MKVLIHTLALVAVSILLASSTVRAGPSDLPRTPTIPGSPYGTSLKGTLSFASNDPGAGLRLAAALSLRAGLPAGQAEGVWSLPRSGSASAGPMHAEHLAFALAGLAVVAGICRLRSWSLVGV
jgi:hypothetical protein